ncbi:site-specific DNA-methyltransferase, partial [candidate division KSB3 bacterium]|nr:site-specific DNA-methyltransferase [candidate division KSB3 bacterium]MBD3327400.1 site-specific DNA-methyltransferase [candidate division KSB3 bacterium]
EWREWGSRGVWTIASVRANNDHEAKFPVELPERVIKLLTDPEDIVLDCFMGSGSTAIAAIRQNRRYIGIELDPKYVNLSRKNIDREASSLTLC